jgi:16S rRNA (uracil1498-N3)-methyltransferase
MQIRRFYIEPDKVSVDSGQAVLDHDETRHLRDVLRLREGAEVTVFDGQGREFLCMINTIKKDHAILDLVSEKEPAVTESPLKLTLAIAMLKGEKLDWVVQKVTELGVSNITLLDTEHSEVRTRNESDSGKRVSRLRRIALEAAKQSGRAVVPLIAGPLPIQQILNDPGDVHRFFFTERGGGPIPEGLTNNGECLTAVAVTGPEGGWSEHEVAAAAAFGWHLVTLGQRILRAETAAITAAVLLQHRFGDLG